MLTKLNHLTNSFLKSFRGDNGTSYIESHIKRKIKVFQLTKRYILFELLIVPLGNGNVGDNVYFENYNFY